MEMLNSMYLSSNLWTNLIEFFVKGIGNYGWAIILFTICLKLVMTPLDILQRTSSQKQTKVMAIMQPEMQALQAKYGNDREKINQEQAKLYKKYNVSIGGMCGTLLVTMVISMVVLFSLYGSLRGYGNEKLYTTYQEIDQATEAVLQDRKVETLNEEELNNLTIVIQEKYDEVSKKNSWLWVKNVWKSDTNTSQFVDFEDYAKYMKFEDSEKEFAKDRYDIITKTATQNSSSQNGYYVLIILCVVISFLTQFLTTKLMTPKGQKLNPMNMVMFAVIPLTMLILATTSNVVFTLYIIVNSVMAALISTIITLIINRKNKGKDDKEIIMGKKKVEVVEYSRNYQK